MDRYLQLRARQRRSTTNLVEGTSSGTSRSKAALIAFAL
jgi:hypothetical protein